MSKTALVVGSTGIIGEEAAKRFAAEGFTVHGLARRPGMLAGVRPLAADLRNPASLRDALADVEPTHVVITAWLRQTTESENIRVNAAMVRNVLDGLSGRGVEHVALVTGLKHYLGPFEAYASGPPPQTPLRETQARLELENFYYAQEDELFVAAERDGFDWTVHRPHTVIGAAVGHAMNMGNTLAAFASICRETGRPFRFPGSAQQWNGLTDMTDAGLLAEHVLWAATTPAVRNEAYNVVNGDVFRWRVMWPRLAAWFGIEPVPFSDEILPLEQQLADAGGIWAALADKYGLVEGDLGKVASPWHTDADLGRPIEVVTDMSKSRKAGFLAYRATDDCFLDLFARLRAARIIP
jgi:nucleoside-diphosphate-sugar epimerase